jgi:flagellar biosynthesis anti-sigma factor FlgM
MKINDVGGNGGPRAHEVNSSRTGKSGRPASAERSGRDSIEVSDGARRLAGLADDAKRLPEVRTELVEALRKSIGNGTYHVDTRELARAILEFEDGLFG